MELIIGGIRSGKSAFAERRALQQKSSVTYLATAYATNSSMKARIQSHQQRRPIQWQLIEPPYDLFHKINEIARSKHVFLWDCLTLWLSAQWPCEPEEIFQQLERVISLVNSRQSQMIIVTDELGLGGISSSKLSREFADALGECNQFLAERAKKVWWVIAGIPQLVKSSNHA